MASWTVAHVRGIPLRIHWTLLAVLPFFAWLMAAEYFPVGGEVTAWSLVWGALLAVGLFVSVLVHEFSHSFMALRLGGKVKSILLMPLGGVSQMEAMPDKPREEFLVTIVGPLTNYLIAGPLLILAYSGFLPDHPPGLLAFLRWAGLLNVGIGTFNLFVPAFPLDGGRLLRAGLASRMGPVKATRIAASVGRGLAFGLGLLGVLSFQAGGLWLILIAFFIYLGAGAEERSTLVQSLLKGLQARDLMTEDLVVIRRDSTMDEMLATMMQTHHTSFPVVEDGRVVGCIGLGELAEVPRGRRAKTAVGAVMHTDIVRITPDTSAIEVLQAVQREEHQHAVVIDGDDLVGLVSATDLQRVVRVLGAAGKDNAGATDSGW